MAKKLNVQTLSKGTPQPGAPAQAKPAWDFYFHWKIPLFLAFISFCVYANTLYNGFALDDAVMLTHNSFVKKGVAAIPEILSTPHQLGFWVNPNDEYRPLSLVVFALGYQFWADSPMPYHLVNILLFAACVVLLFRFLGKLPAAGGTGVAFLASFLFALHPLHTEVVANIKSSDELLCFLFVFLSMGLYIRFMRSGKMKHLLPGFFCFLLSLFSKETALTFLAVIPLVFFFYIHGNKKRSIYISASAGFAAILFLIARYLVLDSYHISALPHITLMDNALAMPGLHVESRMATAILILGYYLKLLFWPWPLLCDYSYRTIPYVHFSHAGVLLSLLLYAFLAFVAVLRFVKNHKDPYVFCIAFFFITLSISANILVLIKSTMGERFLFFPSVGFCLAIALLMDKWVRKTNGDGANLLKHPKIFAILLPLCVAYSVIIIARNCDWDNNCTLYKADAAKTPQNARLSYLYGYELFSEYKQGANPAVRQQLLDSAIFFFRRSLAVYPDYNYPIADLGGAYYCNGQYDSAEVYDSKAIQQNNYSPTSRNNLSGTYLKEKKYAQDIALCKTTMQLLPGDGGAYADIGVAYIGKGSYDSAVYYLYRGIAADPQFYGCYSVLGNIYNTLGKPDSARKYNARAQELFK